MAVGALADQGQPVVQLGHELGVRTAFATDIAHLPEKLGMVRAIVIAAVPRVFEKVDNSAPPTAHTTHKGPIFDRPASVAVRWSRERHG